MTFTPTEEQLAIIEAASQTDDNLAITALAGAAKTSTLVLIAEALPSVEILCLAFNKKIALEMQERLPSNCKAMTLNALGHRTWMEACGRRLRLEATKTYDILTELLESVDDRAAKRELYDNFATILRTIDFGKACGYIPTGTYETPPFKAKRLVDDEDFFSHVDEQLTSDERDVIREATLRSLKMSFEGTIDFNDQILMPTIFHGAFPRYPLILVDEAQDLSALNHATLRKLVKKRLIAVGDPCQAIYGFRGAHEDSMNKLANDFSMRELPLTISFRCPQEVVKHARWRAPQMQYPDWAAAGSVSTLSHWRAEELPDNGAVICRNNAPLFRCAIRLLKNGRYAEMKNDIGKALLKVLKKMGGNSLPRTALLDAIASWEDKQLTKVKKRAQNGVRDRAECLRIFAKQGETLGDAVAFAEHLFNARGPLKLMTGHASKGLEFDHVFFLDAHLVGDEDQDRNLRYVIQTRAKQSLTYITSEGFVDEHADDL